MCKGEECGAGTWETGRSRSRHILGKKGSISMLPEASRELGPPWPLAPDIYYVKYLMALFANCFIAIHNFPLPSSYLMGVGTS